PAGLFCVLVCVVGRFLAIVWLGWGRSGAVLRRSCDCWRRLRLSAAAWLLGCARVWVGVGPVDVLGCRRGWAGVEGVGGWCCGLGWGVCGGVSVWLVLGCWCVLVVCRTSARVFVIKQVVGGGVCIYAGVLVHRWKWCCLVRWR